MVLVDVAHDHIVQPSIARAFHAAAKWLAGRRAERRRRAALLGLLRMPEHRLRDMGLSHDEVIRAIQRRR